MPEILTAEPAESILSIMKPYSDKDGGDLSLKWNKGSTFEVDNARRMFDEAKAKGYVAYKTDSSGNQGEIIRSFDPTAERITMRMQVVGG